VILFHSGAEVESNFHTFGDSVLGQLAAIFLHFGLLDSLHDAVGVVNVAFLFVAIHFDLELPEGVLNLLPKVLIAR